MIAKVDLDKCTGCSACVDSCPVNAIIMENDKAVVGEECIGCGACVDVCPMGAITVS
ncbi:MAG: 4Fe-4S dicluster domain-containing protein [Candidatus Omnitrophica bacterium]|nr:4Fe-4S dicluster domain-containing protein [Candidatus Omnitrophota bacterium]